MARFATKERGTIGMPSNVNPVVGTYSRLARKYDDELNLRSCWGRAAEKTLDASYDTYYDTLEGHWAWWVRIEAQLAPIPKEKKRECNREVKEALLKLTEDRGIPYTIHQLHVSLRRV
jgi:hypothetical protein